MKKICHLTNVHSRYDIRILYKECSTLAGAGYQVVLLLHDDKPDETINQVKIHGTGYSFRNRFQRMFKGSRILLKEALKINADIYHIHDPELLLIARSLKKKKKKVIFDSHENYTLQIQLKRYIPKGARKLLSVCYPIYENQVVKRIDGVIIPCTFHGKNIFKGKCAHYALINNLPLAEEIKNYTEREDSYTRHAVCYIGSLTYERGIYHLIMAAYQAGVKVILGGKFLSRKFEEKVKAMPEYQCVDYRGFLNREQIKEVYHECDAGICALLSVGQHNIVDNLSTKIYEYMAAGLPVILSKGTYGEKVNQKYSFGLAVDPQNIRELKEAILFLIKNRKKAAELGKNGRKLVLSQYNWDVEAEKLINLYQEI